HERLAVPERVAVVARAGQSLRGYRAFLAANRRLEDAEKRVPHRQLQPWVAIDLDVGTVPEFVEQVALCCEEPVPACVFRLGETAEDLRSHRRSRASARPPIRKEL